MHGDNWKIYQDKAMNGDGASTEGYEWRWRITASNGEIVGASTEGYDAKADCFDNARRNGMSVDLLIEQVI